MDVEMVLARKAQAFGTLETWKSMWQRNSEYVAPQLDINEELLDDYPSEGDFDQIYDTTGVQAVETYANGLMTEIFPANERWAIWKSQDLEESANDEVMKWYAKCSEIALKHLASSNFYQEMKPFLKSQAITGTSAINVRAGKRSLLRFTNNRAGTYAIEEDDEGYVDTIFREMKMSSMQMVKMFGEDKVGEKVKENYEKAKKGNTDKKTYTVIHAVMLRTNRDKSKIDSKNKMYASYYICEDDRHMLEESGYDSFPYCVARAEKWDDHVYGIGPTTKALPAIRQLNQLTKDLDAGASVSINPRVLVAADMVDEIDWSEGGVTVFDPTKGGANSQMPVTWGDNVRYDVGVELQVAKREEIRKFFHSGLFEAIAEKTKQMTAREVAAIESAELRSFLPNFNQLTSEIQPLMNEVFRILLDAGVFPEPPESALDEDSTIALPKTEYTSRISLAMRMVENSAIDRTLERMNAIAQVDPTVFDHVKMNSLLRMTMRNEGVPEDVIEDYEVVMQKMEAREQKQQEAAQAQQAQQLASAASQVATASQGVDQSQAVEPLG